MSANEPVRVLLVEDDPDDAVLLEVALRRWGRTWSVRRVEDAATFQAALDWRPDVIVADYNLPRFSATKALSILNALESDIPFIAISGYVREETMVELIRAGAHDCLQKDRLHRLAPAILREIEQATMRREHLAAAPVRAMAFTDPGTGIANRIRLALALIEALERGERFRLVLLGLERWKDVLHTLGHDVAEAMARGLATRLASLGEGSLAARTSDDEFALLVGPTNTQTDTDLVGNVFAAVHHKADLAGISFDVRVRIGLVAAPDHGDFVGALLRRATIALEHARRTERDWYRYDVDQDPWSPRRLVLLNDLRHAAARGELYLVFQPRIRIATRELAGFEALLRWRHPTFGMVAPDQFIPFAEQTGLIHSITEWVLRESAIQAAAWRADGFEVTVGVNISARTLHGVDLPAHIAELLRRYELPPSAMDLELTESALVTDPVRARSTLEALRDLGVRVLLDDFGTGYSSLGYLRSLPLYALKIDKSFVVGGLEAPEDVSIVRSTIALAHSLCMKVVAEGVESAGALAILSEMGCDEAQGYYLSRPILPLQILPWIKDFLSRPWPR